MTEDQKRIAEELTENLAKSKEFAGVRYTPNPVFDDVGEQPKIKFIEPIVFYPEKMPIEGEIFKARYYTPSIEEIHVGYECEYDSSQSGQPEKWEKITINLGDFYTGVIAEFGRETLDRVRTPYLCKEQIEAEVKNGFELVQPYNGGKHSFNGVILKKGNYWFAFKFFRKIEPIAYLTVIPIDAVKEEIDLDCHLPKYHGRCPSINEFRLIVRLLGI